MRSFKDYAVLSLKGLAIGAADVVPGVSGGTIAFITGIYEELISSLRKINLNSLALLKSKGFSEFWQAINGSFLLALVLGIGTSIISLAHTVTYLLETYPERLWGFFFGLIVASTCYVGKQITRWNPAVLTSLLIGAVMAYGITIATPAQGSDSLLFVFFSGAVAICAMILPGISGSFILLLLGMYVPILDALKSVDLVRISVFISGCVIGLLSFSRLLDWMFKHYSQLTLALLSGFMVGSLNKVWPWKLTTVFFTNRHGEQVPLVQESVLPTLSGQQGELGLVLACMVTGAVIIFAMEKASQVLFSREAKV